MRLSTFSVFTILLALGTASLSGCEEEDVSILSLREVCVGLGADAGACGAPDLGDDQGCDQGQCPEHGTEPDGGVIPDHWYGPDLGNNFGPDLGADADVGDADVGPDQGRDAHVGDAEAGVDADLGPDLGADAGPDLGVDHGTGSDLGRDHG